MPAPARISRRQTGNAINALQKDDFPVHGWYRFVLSFPPHLVRQYINSFGLGPSDALLDPFCGTGTTLVEGKRNRISVFGCDAHPFAALVSRVKTDWNLDRALLRRLREQIVESARSTAAKHDLPFALSSDLPLDGEDGIGGLGLTEDEDRLLPTGFLSRRPLRRLLILRDQIVDQTAQAPGEVRDFFLAALGHVIANGAGNFAFGPEIYRTRAKADYDVLGHFAGQAEHMIADLGVVQDAGLAGTASRVFTDDARTMERIPGDLSAVITSPPYPNEKDYTRTTRVESILLGLITDRASLRQVKQSLLRSNTRNVFSSDQDGAEVAGFASIQKVCRAIEERRLELGKDSGFERLYHKVVAHYFGGMRRHLRALRPKLRPDARLAYVVGDQLSFLMVPVATATLLSEVAEAEGYRTVGCDLWRERVGSKVRNSAAGATSVRVREEVLLLQPT